MRARTVSLFVATVLLSCGGLLESSAAGGTRDIDALVADVGDRLAAYYQRARRLICLERATVIPIDGSWTVQGFARTVESDLRVDADPAAADELPVVRVAREVRRINGREPRERDLTNRAGCTDPAPLSPEPLAFLLPGRRDEYKFTSVRETRLRNRDALTIDFATSRRRPAPELVEDERGHDDCFDWKGPLGVTGRVWVDAATHDVLRLERRLAGPTDVRVPARLQREYGFPAWLTIDRDDLTMSYAEVTFDNPAEVMLLPESIESITVIRTGLQSIRQTQLFSDYRRFLTETRIKGS